MLHDVVAISVVRDEADIVLPCLENLYNCGIRSFVVADNRSRDATRDQLRRFAQRYPEATLVVLDDPDPHHYQSRKLTALAKFGAQYFEKPLIYPFDADEFLCITLPQALGATAGRPADTGLAKLRAGGCDYLLLDWRTCMETSDAAVFAADMSDKFRKVIIRWHDDVVIAQGAHKAVSRHKRWFSAKPRRLRAQRSNLRVLHFPARSFEQLMSKILNGGPATAVTPPQSGKHWKALYSAFQVHGTAPIAELYALIADAQATAADLERYALRYSFDIASLDYFADYFEPRVALDYRIPR